MRIQHIERGLIFIELSGGSDTDVQSAWQDAFGDLGATIGTRTVIIHAPAIGWYTAGAGGTHTPVRLNAFTPGEAITAAAIENEPLPAPWTVVLRRVAALLIVVMVVLLIAKGA